MAQADVPNTYANDLYRVLSDDLGRILIELSVQTEDPIDLPENFSRTGHLFSLTAHNPNKYSVRFYDSLGYGWFLWESERPCADVMRELLEKNLISVVPKK